MPSASRPSGACVNCLVLAFVAASVLYVAGSARFWKFRKGFAVVQPISSSSSSSSAVVASPGCPLCLCDCSPPLSLDAIASGLLNLSIKDCGRNDTELGKEMEKQFADLLNEELKLLEDVAQERARRMNLTLMGAKRLASKYQKEADKCIAATMTCETARERAEADLRREKKMTDMWERRARRRGWKSRNWSFRRRPRLAVST